jgi:hypothetical protein
VGGDEIAEGNSWESQPGIPQETDGIPGGNTWEIGREQLIHLEKTSVILLKLLGYLKKTAELCI